MARWVSHISATSRKWKVLEHRHGPPDSWPVENTSQEPIRTLVFYLPKSEYIEVPAPEEWRDISASLRIDGDGDTRLMDKNGEIAVHVFACRKDLRLRRLTYNFDACVAFIVEQTVQP